MFADLHLHTNFSDGTYTPEELAAQAKRFGFTAVALTDHDTVEGCHRMALACKAANVEFIPASELTADMNGHELHLLGYYLDTANPLLLTELARFQQVRQDRIREMVVRINGLGFPLSVDDVFSLANCRSPGRPHVARALVQAELCGSIDEAFERFLKKGRPAWVPKFKMSAPEAIELIHQARGLAVLAHPGLTRADELIPELAEMGMDGLECIHTKHSNSVAEQYLVLAARLNLLPTGGSDCHGLTKGKPLIGTVKVPYEYVERMKSRIVERTVAAGVHLAG
jgi:hypothetical protein